MKRLRYKYCTYLSRKFKIRSALLPMAELISGSKKFFNWVGDQLAYGAHIHPVEQKLVGLMEDTRLQASWFKYAALLLLEVAC